MAKRESCRVMLSTDVFIGKALQRSTYRTRSVAGPDTTGLYSLFADDIAFAIRGVGVSREHCFAADVAARLLELAGPLDGEEEVFAEKLREAARAYQEYWRGLDDKREAARRCDSEAAEPEGA